MRRSCLATAFFCLCMASVHHSRYIQYGESLQFSNYAAQTALPYQIASPSARQKQKQGNSRGTPTPGHLHVSPLRLAPLLHAGAAAKSLLPRPPIRQYLLVLPLANLAAEVSFYFFKPLPAVSYPYEYICCKHQHQRARLQQKHHQKRSSADSCTKVKQQIQGLDRQLLSSAVLCGIL